MFSKELLYKDIESICRDTNAIYGRYTYLHDFGENGEALKLPEFIENAKKLMGDNAAHYLYRAGIICQQVGGDYDFNFPCEVMEGGGMSYDKIGAEDGLDYKVVYFFDDESDDDRYNIYHELGHLMQFEHKMFKSKEVNSIYKFLSKGIGKKPVSKKQMTKVFADAFSYQYHLLEVHANSFATACMLLRTENKRDRLKQSINCYLRGGSVFFNGLTDKEKKYPGMKFYANLPLQKQIIKEVNRWYKSGEINQYKNEAGDINFHKLALKIKELVIEHSYSPRTFKQFLNMEFLSTHPLSEKGWRHSIPEALITYGVQKLCDTERRYLKDKYEYHEMIDKERKYPQFQKLPEKNETAKLLNVCCQLDDALISLDNAFDILEIQISDYDELDLDRAIKYGGIPDSVINVVYKKMSAGHEGDEEIIKNILSEYKKDIDSILAGNYNKEKVCDIMCAMNTPASRNVVWEMYYARRINPDLDNGDDNILVSCIPEPPRNIQKAEVHLLKAAREIIVNKTFEKNSSISRHEQHKIMQRIVQVAADNPDLLTQPDFVNSLLPVKSEYKNTEKNLLVESLNKLHTLYFMDTELFNGAMNKHQQALLHYIGDENREKKLAKYNLRSGR